MQRAQAPSQLAKRAKTSAKSKSRYVKSRYAPKTSFGVPRSISFSKGGAGFPPQLGVKLRYATTVSLTPNLTSNATQVFLANGLYDPDVTGTGHQPMYYDNLTAVYDHWIVKSSVAKYTFKATSSGVIMRVGWGIDDDASAPSGLAQQELYGGHSHIITSVDPPVTRKSYWNYKQTFGGDLMSNSNLRGAPSVDPAELSYFYVSAIDVQASSTTDKVIVDVLIEYDCIFFELKTQALN